jgi:hypothetical protein
MLQQSNRLRCAFTIAEMLTVLAIIVLLMTLVLGAVSYVGTWQMKRQTEQTMVKALGHLDRWIEKIRSNAEHPLNTPSYNAIKQVALQYADQSQAGFQQRAAVLRFKLLYKFRMPNNISELQTAATNVLGSGDGDPDMKVIYSYNPITSPTDQSSRCLALILYHLARGDFSEKEIDPVSMQVLDAWGNPIQFYRYGYPYPNPKVKPVADEVFAKLKGKDPLDPAGILDNNWWSNPSYAGWHKSNFGYDNTDFQATYAQATYAPLLLVSAGPDGVFGTSDDILSYTLRPVAGGR